MFCYQNTRFFQEDNELKFVSVSFIYLENDSQIKNVRLFKCSDYKSVFSIIKNSEMLMKSY